MAKRPKLVQLDLLSMQLDLFLDGTPDTTPALPPRPPATPGVAHPYTGDLAVGDFVGWYEGDQLVGGWIWLIHQDGDLSVCWHKNDQSNGRSLDRGDVVTQRRGRERIPRAALCMMRYTGGVHCLEEPGHKGPCKLHHP